MFICYDCSTVSDPKVKPTKVVTLTRDMEYHNTRVTVDEFSVERKEKVDSVGYETVQEVDLCPKCANVPIKRIKRALREDNLQLKVSLAGCAIQSALERLGHRTHRAKRDTTAAIPLLKQFIDNNPKFAV